MTNPALSRAAYRHYYRSYPRPFRGPRGFRRGCGGGGGGGGRLLRFALLGTITYFVVRKVAEPRQQQ